MKESVLIFGGSQGIGRIIASYFAAKNADLTVAARGIDALDKIRKEFNINTVIADVSNEEQVKNAFEEHKRKFEVYPNIVVNTAGIQGPIGPSWKISADEWENTLKINLLGSFIVTKAAIDRMIPNKFGSIIHFSGGGAAYARPNFSAYGSSKTGLLRFVETVAEELELTGHEGIIINAIAPGAVKTRMTQEVISVSDKAGDKAIKEAQQTMESGGTPPEQIISLVEFLSDPLLNKGLTGRLIHVRENYADFIEKSGHVCCKEAGKLRRIPLE